MEIKIATFQKGTPAQEFLPLITDAHNLRYSYAEKNCLYFQIFRFPYKEMTKAVAGHEDGTVKFMKSYIVHKKTAGKLPPFSFTEKRTGAVALARRPAVR